MLVSCVWSEIGCDWGPMAARQIGTQLLLYHHPQYGVASLTRDKFHSIDIFYLNLFLNPTRISLSCYCAFVISIGTKSFTHCFWRNLSFILILVRAKLPSPKLALDYPNATLMESISARQLIQSISTTASSLTTMHEPFHILPGYLDQCLFYAAPGWRLKMLVKVLR